MTIFFAGNRDLFSNFNPTPVEDPEFGVTWPTSEHAFMARKARVFGDELSIEQLKRTNKPQEAKAIGRRVSNFNPQHWDEVKEQCMEEALMLKFASGEPRQFLLSTGDQELVEAAPWDRIWGIGMDAQTARHTPRDRWGENLLGEALMRVRKRLRNQNKI